MVTIYGTRDRLDKQTYPRPCQKGGNAVTRTCTQCEDCPACTECSKNAQGQYVPNVPPGCQQSPCPLCIKCPADCADCLPQPLDANNAKKRCRDQAPSMTTDLRDPCECYAPRCGCNPVTDPTCCPKDPSQC